MWSAGFWQHTIDPNDDIADLLGLRGTSIIAPCETVQGRETCAIGINGEHRAIGGTAAAICHPIQGVAG